MLCFLLPHGRFSVSHDKHVEVYNSKHQCACQQNATDIDKSLSFVMSHSGLLFPLNRVKVIPSIIAVGFQSVDSLSMHASAPVWPLVVVVVEFSVQLESAS